MYSNNPIDDIGQYFSKLKERLSFSSIKFRPGMGVSLLVALAVLVYVCYNSFFVYVHPYEYGIKVVRIGMDRGVQKDSYGAGLAFVLPFGLQQIYLLPRGIQVLELTNSPETAAGGGQKRQGRPYPDLGRIFCGCGCFHALPHQRPVSCFYHHWARHSV